MPKSNEILRNSTGEEDCKPKTAKKSLQVPIRPKYNARFELKWTSEADRGQEGLSNLQNLLSARSAETWV